MPAPLFQQRDFSALWWGQLISILGERLTYLALVGLLAQHTDQFRDPKSSLLLTVLANVMLAPVLAFAPFTGVWVDRMNLKRVLVTSDALRCVIVVLIPLLYQVTHHTVPVFALVFLLFTCNVFFLPAKSAMTPEIVDHSQLLAANALLAGAGIAATAAGALAGGWFVDHWGWPVAMFLNGGTYLVSVAALLVIRYRPARSSTPAPAFSWRRYLREVSDGWSVVRTSPPVGLALTALAAVWVGGGFLHVAGNQHIQRAASQPGMERLGVLMFVVGVGAGLGTWWVNAHARRWPRSTILGASLVLAAGALVVFALSSRFVVFAAVAFVIGLSSAPAFTLSETLLQEGTELKQRGRVFSARDFLMRLVFLLGVTTAGWSTRSLGIRATLLMCGGVIAVASALAFAHARRMPRPRAPRAEDPVG